MKIVIRAYYDKIHLQLLKLLFLFINHFIFLIKFKRLFLNPNNLRIYTIKYFLKLILLTKDKFLSQNPLYYLNLHLNISTKRINLKMTTKNKFL